MPSYWAAIPGCPGSELRGGDRRALDGAAGGLLDALGGRLGAGAGAGRGLGFGLAVAVKPISPNAVWDGAGVEEALRPRPVRRPRGGLGLLGGGSRRRDGEGSDETAGGPEQPRS